MIAVVVPAAVVTVVILLLISVMAIVIYKHLNGTKSCCELELVVNFKDVAVNIKILFLPTCMQVVKQLNGISMKIGECACVLFLRLQYQKHCFHNLWSVFHLFFQNRTVL